MSTKFQLRQKFFLESARFLPHLPPSHPCARMHGHSFQVTLVWEGEIDQKVGWVVDYHEVEKQWLTLKEQLDHRILNEVPGLENPTSEHLAHWIFQRAKAWLPQLVQVIVSETPNTECRYPV